jgi:hypothetical protein
MFMLKKLFPGVPSPCMLAASTLLLGMASQAHADVVNILFVGNSYTHGRYDPVLNYNAGPANAPGNGTVHDLLCPSAPCGGVEAGPQMTPTVGNTLGGTLSGQLSYLQAHPSSQYNEVGPRAGTSGIFLQFTKDVGLNYNVSTGRGQERDPDGVCE